MARQIEMIAPRDLIPWAKNARTALLHEGCAGVTNVGFDLRFTDEANIFDEVTGLFGNLSDGQVFDLTDLTFARLSIGYDTGIVNSTIFLGNRFDSLTLSYDAPAPVPLPAGLPLLVVGLGAFAALRRFGAKAA